MNDHTELLVKVLLRVGDKFLLRAPQVTDSALDLAIDDVFHFLQLQVGTPARVFHLSVQSLNSVP